jgi:hypothetical protein
VLLYTIYALYTGLALLSFRWLPARTAVLATFFAGWLILPVGHFPPDEITGSLPWWIVGLALPSSMLATKAWVAAGAALLGGILFDRAALAAWRPRWIDLPMAAWCLWPLVDGLLATDLPAVPAPAPILASLYVLGCWGLPWLIGRIWIVDAADRTALLTAIVWSGAVLLPVAVAEGVAAPFLYDAVYGAHPFCADGMVRYVGYRPLALFENGNQYGIWIAVAALAATWLAFMRGDRGSKSPFGNSQESEFRGGTGPHPHPAAHRVSLMGGRVGVRAGTAKCVSTHFRTASRPRRATILWLVVATMAVAAQSVGALLLAAAGIAFLGLRGRALVRPLAIAGVGSVALLAAVHLSGIVPLEHIARNTPVGQQVLATMRGVGRGSFTWRLSQDAKVLPAIHAAPLAGTARWDWFRPFATRPWGLTMLILGQFGAIGLCLAFGAVVAPAMAVLFRRIGYGAWERDGDALPLAVIVLVAMADATLNSFVYLPAILIAGGIAVRPRRREVV